MCQNCYGGLGRRTLIAGLAGGVVSACSENPASGRRQLAFVPDDQLAKLADQSWVQLLQQIEPANDPVLGARLARVGAPLVRAAGRDDLAWEFVVLASEDLNAFVLPNGKVGVFRGMMAFAERDDELGAVIGHEVAHVVARHAAERVSQQLAVQAGITIAQLLLGGDNGENAQLVGAALGLGATFGVLLPYSRAHELEADRIGVDLMRRVGMEPGAAVRFWERMMVRQARAGEPIEALSTHPANERRLAELKAAASSAPTATYDRTSQGGGAWGAG
jgi:predicted Zn-dependent protease